MPTTDALERCFPRLTEGDPTVPVWCVTPGHGGCIVRFFDTSAVSPGGRYLAATRLPFEDRLPAVGDAAQIVLVDLDTGKERVIAQTLGWEAQLGAQVNWGEDDATLLFSDLDPATWTPHAVRLNHLTGERARLDGPIYHASPDGRLICGGDPKAMRRTQAGYGVVVPDEAVPLHEGAPADTGLFLNDTRTGERRLATSLADAVAAHAAALGLEDVGDWRVYLFHSKFSPDGSRVLFTLRYYPASRGAGDFDQLNRPETRYAVLTCRLDGSDVRLAVGPEHWDRGGHHVNWLPDSSGLTMNLRAPDGHAATAGLARDHNGREPMLLYHADLDGRRVTPVHGGVVGSGHPTFHPDGRHVLTDAYAYEQVARDGRVPLRWIDRHTGTERAACWLKTRTPPEAAGVSELRCDPHPAWDRTHRWVAFNAFEDGTRRVYLADFAPLLKDE